nr:hypothetical protein [Pseudomonadota bacterium]
MRAPFILLLILTCLLSNQASGQGRTEPIVEVEFKEEETIPGQYLTLRVTVLVPTWMPEPVAFPPLDVPNLRIRQPERSTSPTSRTIDGESWSGVSRRYLVSPMVPGEFSIPVQKLQVTYADPQTSEPVKVELAVDPVTLRGIVPKGAESLDPFIAANGLSLSHEISENLLELKPGDSITRTITAKITGASPIILPHLTEVPAIGGFAAYRDDPVVEEHDERGVVSGTRSEKLTLMVQGNGSGILPALHIDWYDIDGKKVQTATLDPVEISATGASVSASNRLADWDLKNVIGLCTLMLLLGLTGFLAWPYLRRHLRDRQARKLAGKNYALKLLLEAIRQKDLSTTIHTLDDWAGRSPVTPAVDLERIERALLPITSARYGLGGPQERSEDWQAVSRIVRKMQSGHLREASAMTLPALNP